MLRVIRLLLVGFLLIGGTTLAHAQEMPVFCGDLAEADCALLTESQAAMQALDSATADFELNLVVEGLPDVDAPLNLGVTGSLAYSGANAVRDLAMPELEATPDVGAMVGMAADALAHLDAQLKLQVSLPPELTETADSTMPSEINLELMLVDGTAYLNVDTLTALINNSRLEGWYGVDVVGLLRMMTDQMAGLTGSMSSDMMGMNPELMAMAQDPALMAGFATIARTDDGSSDMATFEITIDLAALYSDPTMAAMLRQQMVAQMGMSGTTMTDEQLDQAMTMVTQMFEEVDIKVIEMIGVTDKYVHSTQVTFTMDMSQMMAMAGETGAAPKVALDMTIRQGQFNSVPPITAPEDAIVIPLASIGAMIGRAMPAQ